LTGSSSPFPRPLMQLVCLFWMLSSKVIYFRKALYCPLTPGPSRFAVPLTTSGLLAPSPPHSPTNVEQSIIVKVLSIWGICLPKEFQIQSIYCLCFEKLPIPALHLILKTGEGKSAVVLALVT
jgi:hypothetical protein